MKEQPHTLGRLWFLGAVLAVGSASAHAAPPKLDANDQRVIKKLEAVLRKRVSSPTGNLKIVIKPTERASEGYFREVLVQGSPVKVKKLNVSSINLHARNVRIDVPYLFAEDSVKTLDSKTALTAVISENDLTQMLSAGRHTKAMGLKVKYMGDRLMVTGNLNWTLINGPITGVGRLRMAPGHLVYLDILSLKLRGVEVPQLVKNQFSSRVNPVINYADLPFNPPFKGVKVNGAKATLYTQ